MHVLARTASTTFSRVSWSHFFAPKNQNKSRKKEEEKKWKTIFKLFKAKIQKTSIQIWKENPLVACSLCPWRPPRCPSPCPCPCLRTAARRKGRRTRRWGIDFSMGEDTFWYVSAAHRCSSWSGLPFGGLGGRGLEAGRGLLPQTCTYAAAACNNFVKIFRTSVTL